ncbi:hypothetical protein HMI55_001510 [Coelomomyces lativittatus]|nr:hypothetical protein HMI55_001510 [Coelomomyces lativittatus]KAJ1514051.1 hypothetical protein HMI56_001253 [Coelomomyces lativittatus]
MLLLMVFATFSNTFASKTHFSIFPFLLIFLMVSILLPLSMVLCFVLGKTLFHPPETVSIVYCGSTKTLSLGIPILTLLFPNSAETTLPLLLYHALQLFLGGAVAPWLGRWVKSHETSRSLEDGELI